MYLILLYSVIRYFGGNVNTIISESYMIVVHYCILN